MSCICSVFNGCFSRARAKPEDKEPPAFSVAAFGADGPGAWRRITGCFIIRGLTQGCSQLLATLAEAIFT